MNLPDSFDVRVTRLDIRRGTPRDPCDCPLALALMRRFRLRRANVTTLEAYVSVGSDGMFIHDGEAFVRRFDDDKRRRYCRPSTVHFTREASQ